MKIYKAFIKQDADGCDHTIACAETVIDLKATTMDEAMMELYETIKEEYSDEESRLEKAEIYEIEQILPFNLEEIYKRIDNAEYEAQQKAEEEKERKEFERLKGKFGN